MSHVVIKLYLLIMNYSKVRTNFFSRHIFSKTTGSLKGLFKVGSIGEEMVLM